VFHSYKIADFLKNTVPLERDDDKSVKGVHFHINRLEDMPPLPSNILTPHKHHFYELFLVTQGEVLHMVDYQQYHLSAHNFFFISQGQLHFWDKTKRDNVKGYRLMFTEEFFLLNQMDNLFLFELIYLDNIYQNPFIPITPKIDSLVYTYFDLLFQEFQRKNSYDKALQSLLFLLLFEVQRLYEKRSPSEATKHQAFIFKQFIIQLETHFSEKWSASDYADALHVSSRHLNRIVQSVTNQSLTQVIQNRIVLEAKRLLTFTDLTIGQISDKLGFEDAAYFARYFRKVTNFSPTDFKEKLSEKYR
jgi:AraC family transcriptional regulator, transcriptional activator of pobA